MLQYYIAKRSYLFFLMTLSVSRIIIWIFSENISNFIEAIIFTIPMVLLHDGHIFVTLSYFLIYLLKKQKGYKTTFFKLFILLLVILVAFLFLSGLFGSYVSVKNFNLLDSVRRSYWNHFMEGAGSRYLLWMSPPNDWLQFIIYTPIRIIYFLFSPLPTEWRGIKNIISFVSDSCIHICGFYCVIYSLIIYKNFGSNIPKEAVLSIETCGCIIIMLSFVFSWGTASGGTAIRHRLCLIPVDCLAIFLKHNYFSLKFSKESRK